MNLERRLKRKWMERVFVLRYPFIACRLTAEKHHLTTQRDQLAQDVSAVVKEYEAQHQELLRIRAEADEASRRYATDLVDIRASRDELQKLLLVQEQHLTAAHDGLDR